MSSQFSLLRTRRFGPLFWSQFCGALNDNLVKNALVVALAFGAGSAAGGHSAGVLTNMAAGLFVLPFFLFSALSGQLADRFDRGRIAVMVKVLESIIVGGAALALWLGNLPGMLLCVFLLGTHSAIFGPVKYALLPQHLSGQELVGGNALVEAGTFAAILAGSIAGGQIAGASTPWLWLLAFGWIFSFGGMIAASVIPSSPGPAMGQKISWNLAAQTFDCLAKAKKIQAVHLSVMGISWFWLFGALVLAQLPSFGRDILGGGESSVSILLAIFAFGVGLGSLLCEKLSAGRVEIGLVPFGALGMTLSALGLWWFSPALPPFGLMAPLSSLLVTFEFISVSICLCSLGVFGGFFIVPLYALVQNRTSAEDVAAVVAANNILNAIFMVTGAAFAAFALWRGIGIPGLFLTAAVANLIVALWIIHKVPEFFSRFLAWMAARVAIDSKTSGINPGEVVWFGPWDKKASLALAACSVPPARLAIPSSTPRSESFLARLSGAIDSNQDFDFALESIRARGEFLAVFSEQAPVGVKHGKILHQGSRTEIIAHSL